MKNCTNITIKGDKHGSALKKQIYKKLDLTFFSEGPKIWKNAQTDKHGLGLKKQIYTFFP